MKRREAIDLVREHGEKYGWTYSETSGIRYEPERLGQSITKSKWNLINDISYGDKTARKLASAIRKVAMQDIRNAERRNARLMAKSQGLELDYAQLDKEILDRQHKRLVKHRDTTRSILDLENILRESTDEAFRQTPMERGTKAGMQARIDKSKEQLEKALTSGNFAGKVSFVDPDMLNVIKELDEEFNLGINLGELVSKHKQKEGSPYIAYEKAFMEASEGVSNFYNSLSREDRQRMIESDEFAILLRAMRIIDLDY